MMTDEILLWPPRALPTEGRINPWPRLELVTPKRTAARAPMIVIFPGGGYARNAPHEGAPVAEFFAERGFVAAVVHYRVGPDRFPAPYLDATRAVRLVRSMSQSLGGDPRRLTALGFSAGGHLAALLGTRPDLVRDGSDDLTASVSARPDRMILAYPVVSFLNRPHAASVRNFLGESVDFDAKASLCTDRLVDERTPPAFLFHAMKDKAVSYKHTLLFARSMREHHVPVTTHIAAEGDHGTALDGPSGGIHPWVKEALVWMRGDS
jgi:acetyl esterase/lipase